MQSKGHNKSGWQAVVAGAGSLALLGTVVLFATTAHGCDQGREGDRCNPALTNVDGVNEDECGSGLSCQQPVDCPENYCCPVDGGASANPFCQNGCSGGQASICEAGGDADCAK
jgi:hypothetical protein